MRRQRCFSKCGATWQSPGDLNRRNNTKHATQPGPRATSRTHARTHYHTLRSELKITLALINDHIDNMEEGDQRTEVETFYQNTLKHITGRKAQEQFAEKFAEVAI